MENKKAEEILITKMGEEIKLSELKKMLKEEIINELKDKYILKRKHDIRIFGPQ